MTVPLFLGILFMLLPFQGVGLIQFLTQGDTLGYGLFGPSARFAIVIIDQIHLTPVIG